MPGGKRDFNGLGLDVATNDFVLTGNYSIAVADAALPEPGSLALMALGLAGLARRRAGVAVTE